MTTVELKSDLYQIIDSIEDDNILSAIRVLLINYSPRVEEETEARRKVVEIEDEIPEDYELSEAHKELLDNRLASYRANPERAIPWEEAKIQLGI